MPTPYHVRLAVTQYGDQFRAELFTEDLGDTEGDLLTELPPSLGEWVPYLSQGADLPPDAARQLGKDLFAALLGHPENAKKWSEVLVQAERNNRSVRLLIDATTDSVRDLPYGLMCEPHDDWFLFRGGRKLSVEFVRILRRCSPRPLKLRDRLRVLIAVAEPRSADVPAFSAPLQLQKLCAALREKVDVILCGQDGPCPASAIATDPKAADLALFTPYTVTTRSALRKALAGEYDVFHLLAHGHGAGVLICNADGTPSEATASELGEWCAAGRTSLAFLQVCKAGSSTGRGGFGGVAQQLLNPRGGNLAAVVASTFPLDAEDSTQAAVEFYRQLAAGKSPEQALTSDRPESDWCWAFLELWARPGALGGTQQKAAFQFVSPYRGLSSFGEQDADLFFGRRAEVKELLQIIRAEPAVVVVGDSGSGKSSLLQAGLVHAIRQEGLAGSDRWRIVSLRPGYRPAQALLSALTGSVEEPTPESLRAALRTDTEPLIVIFDQFEELFTLARDKNEVQALSIALADAVEQQRDRFRLVLGMRSEYLGQAASVVGLSRVIRRPWVLRPPGAENLRDIVGGPAEHCGYTFQGPLADGDPRHAIGLLDRILADPLLAADPTNQTYSTAPLPLLQFALERLWLRAVEKGVTEFTHAEFDEIGGMGKAIAQHAEAVFQSAPTGTGLGPDARQLVEQVVTSLVSPQGTRQPRVRAELQSETGKPDAARAVVDYLVGERLLTVRSDPEDLTKSLIDLSHEALIVHWDRLRGWLAEDPQGRAMREEFRQSAQRWETGYAGAPPRNRRGLPGSEVAANYLAWIRTASPRLSPAHQDFVTELRAKLSRERRIRQAITVTLLVLTAFASSLALYADSQASKATQSAEQAQKSERDARESEKKARESEAKAIKDEKEARETTAALILDHGVRLCEQGRPRLGLLAISKSLELCPADATDLRRVIRTNLAGWSPQLMCLEEARQLGGPAIAASAEGEVALIAIGDDSVQLVDMDTGKALGPPFPARGETGPWGCVLRSGKGWRVLTYGTKAARLWDGVKAQPVGPLIKAAAAAGNELGYEVFIAELSPDEHTIAMGFLHGEVWLWDGRNGEQIGPPLKHEGKVGDLDFNADGTLLLTGCSRAPEVPLLVEFKDESTAEQRATAKELTGGIARVWNLTQRKVIWWQWYLDPVTFVDISPDPEGQYLAVGGIEIVVWDRMAHRYVGSRLREPEPGHWAVFDPMDKGSLMIARPSGHVNIFHLDQQRQVPGEHLSPQGWLAGAGFRTKDNALYTLNRDGTVRIWLRPLRTKAEHEYKHPDAVLSVSFGPKGDTFAAGCRDGNVYYWATSDPELKPKVYTPPPRPSGQPLRWISQVKVSADGKRIIAQDLYCRTFVWETATGRLLTPPEGETLVASDADGEVVLTHRSDHNYRVRNLLTGEAGKLFTLPRGLGPDPEEIDDDEHLLRVKRVAFSPDRSRVAVITRSGKVELHLAVTGELVGGPIGHMANGRLDDIRAVEFSPDGKRFLTQSQRVQRLWSTATVTAEHEYANPVGIQMARFSSCGRLVLSATNFNMAQVWAISEKEPLVVGLLHSAQVWGVTSNSTCDRIATASYDHTARSWDLTTGRALSPPLPHNKGVSDVIYNHDGSRILTASWDRNVRLWKAIQPVPDDVKRVTTWIETMTGLRVSDTGSADYLSADEWTAKKKQLDEMGGPPWTHIQPTAPVKK